MDKRRRGPVDPWTVGEVKLAVIRRRPCHPTALGAIVAGSGLPAAREVHRRLEQSTKAG